MDKILKINPYTVPEGQHGWRGLSVAGNHKRKWYTVLQNERVLVTALLLMPGEISIRHSHESGELSVHYSSDLKPMVTWNPPGMLHGGAPVTGDKTTEVAENLIIQGPTESSGPEVAKLFKQIRQLQLQIEQLQQELQEIRRPDPSPRVIIDTLFPPFATTIDDPAYPEKKTVIGQWFD